MAVVPDRPTAEQVAGNLRLAGFPQEALSIVEVTQDEDEELQEHIDETSEGIREVAVGAVKGAFWGTLLGLVLGVVTLYIPGVNVISPVVLLALFGGSGAFVGTLAGAFGSEVTSELVIQRYGMALREGQAVIRVTAPSAEAARKAEALLHTAGATNINAYMQDASRLRDVPAIRTAPGVRNVSRRK